ncbi:MAG: hypothetical protein CVU55_12770 [Deltaproteobacteria bacterium HGW-Deltaproteobacteria-13]|jgi:opacity protein-like surface antigen|nr:MAG: hypothetical protein CVU55_12770 [Deltaproteobacteria bacterium HGW-Deltaproteobacteria-13]
MNKKENKKMKRILFSVIFIAIMMFSVNVLAQNDDQVLSNGSNVREHVYVGFQGSYNEGTSKLYNGESFEQNISGGLGGLFIGAYSETPYKIVYGLELEGSLGEAGARSSCPNDDYSCHTYVEWDVSLRGRVGYAIGPFLPYVAVGLVWSGVNMEVKSLTTNEAYNSYSECWGLTPGIGLDVTLFKNLFIRAEYSYKYFFPAKLTINEDERDIRLGYSTFKGGIGWKF